jgi:hypothetical protein
MHVNYIIGYDENKKEFITYGYDNKNDLRIITASYDNVEAAYRGCEDQIVECYKPDLDKHYIFNKDILYLQITDFLESKNSLESESDLSSNGLNMSNFVYGISTYERILDHIKELRVGNYGYDVRNLAVLVEHKRLMAQRIDYLVKQKSETRLCGLLSLAYHLLHEVEISKNLMLKWSLSNNQKCINKALEILENTMNGDIELFQHMQAILN